MLFGYTDIISLHPCTCKSQLMSYQQRNTLKILLQSPIDNIWVQVYRLISCGTVEEKIYRNQVFKGGLSRSGMQEGTPYQYFSQQVQSSALVAYVLILSNNTVQLAFCLLVQDDMSLSAVIVHKVWSCDEQAEVESNAERAIIVFIYLEG